MDNDHPYQLRACDSRLLAKRQAGMQSVKNPSHRRQCPVCAGGEPSRFVAGRCRSGRRWFWYFWAEGIGEHGITDTEVSAWAAIRAAVIRMTTGEPAAVWVTHTGAKWALITRNLAKRPATDTDAGFLYYVSLTLRS
jgi:hypothetical protein